MKIKKIITLFMTVCMFSTLFAVPTGAANMKTDEFLANGGFEKVSNVTPTGWAISGAKFGEEVTVVSDVVKSGNNALKMESDEGAMFIRQSVSGLIAGEEYTLSAFVKAEKPASGGAIKFEFYGEIDGKRTYVSDLNIPLDRSSKDWQEIKQTFTMPDTVSSANIMFRIWKGGLFYWDDLSLIGAVAPDADPIPSDNLKAPFENSESIAENGDFEVMASNGYPEAWQAIGNKWEGNQYVSVDKEEVYSGKNSIRISTAAGGAPWIRQIIAIKPNTEYQISAWVRQKGVIPYSRDVRFKFEYYNDPIPSSETSVGGAMVSEGLAPPENQWVQVEQVFTTPPAATYVVVYCRLHSNGTVWFDDVKLFQTGKVPKIIMETDDVFYYPERETGVARVDLTMNNEHLDKGTVDFKLKDGNTVLKEQTGTEFTDDRQAFFKYEISLLSEKKKAYYVEAALKSENGEVIETIENDIYCYDRPTVLTENGDYLNDDGTVFIPTIGNHARAEIYDDGQKLGMNLMQVGYGHANVWLSNPRSLLDVLDDLESKDLKGIVCLYQGMKAASHPDNIETTKAVVKGVKDHPAVFGYAVMDEPLSQIANPVDYIKEAYKIIRDIDDKHPVYLLDANDSEYNLSAKYCDVFVHDPYPSNVAEPAYHVQNMTDVARQAVSRNNKPLLVVNQAFLYGGYFPTSDELRSMWYQSLLGGVKGAGYHTLARMVENEEVYAGISEFAKEEQGLSYDLFTYGGYPDFNDYKDSSYLYKSVVKDGDVYMIVLNRNNEEKKVTVSLKSKNGRISAASGKVVELFGAKGTNPEVSGDEMIISLSGRQSALFKVTGVSIDKARLIESAFDDIYDYVWANDQIDELFAKGIINSMGEGLYKPGKDITRGDFAMFLIRALDLDLRDSRIGENFTDVDENAPYARELAVGKTLGIFRGVGNNAFNPETEISRQDMMVICARSLRYKMAMGGDALLADLEVFSDNSSISDYAGSAIAQMVKDGYVKGNADGTINPLGNTTRAEAAVLMSRIVNR